MALKVMRLQRHKEILLEKREGILQNQEKNEAAKAELEIVLLEVNNEEDLVMTDEKLEENLNEAIIIEAELAKIENQISEIDEELEGLRSKAEAIQTRDKNEGDEKNMNVQRANIGGGVKTRMQEALKEVEVRDFFQTIADHVTKRAVLNNDLLIPKTVIDMIEIDMIALGAVVGLVTRRPLGGTGRIVFAGDTPTAIWTEQSADITELSLSFSFIEVDGYKVSGFIPVSNWVLEDSFINLALHIQQQLATSIARALDTAIVLGEGKDSYQPTGIIPSLPAGNKLSVAADWVNILRAFAILPDDAGSINALMTRNTYYTYFVEQTLTSTADGRIVAQPAVETPRLPDGTPVKFVQKSVVPNGEMLLGDFSKYFLVERAALQLAASTENRFVQDQMLFRGTARYDGKPLKNNYWLHFTLSEAEGGN